MDLRLMRYLVSLLLGRLCSQVALECMILLHWPPKYWSIHVCIVFTSQISGNCSNTIALCSTPLKRSLTFYILGAISALDVLDAMQKASYVG